MTFDHETDNLGLRVREALARLLRVDLALVRPDAALADDLKVDSLEFMAVIVGLEDQFGVTLPDDEAARLRTVSQVIGALRRQIELAPLGVG